MKAKKEFDKPVASYVSCISVHSYEQCVCTAMLYIARETFNYRIKFELVCIMINCYCIKVKHTAETA
jgi:hypothetical protein